jgi:hypothetical protein
VERSERSSRGVLGPLGLLLVIVLWLMTVSGNVPSANLASPPASSQPAYVKEEVVPAFGGSADHLTTLATHPASMPTAGTGV